MEEYNRNKLLKISGLLLVIIVVVLIGAGCTAITERAKGGQKPTDEQSVEQVTEQVSPEASDSEEALEAIPVETVELVKSTMNDGIYTFGYLEAKESYFVTPYSAGIVDEILVNVGDYVLEGDLLYQLNPEDLDLSKERDMLQQSTSISNAKTSLDSQALTLQQRESDVASRLVSLDTAKKNYEDSLVLFESSIVSKAELDGSKTALDQAQIAYDQAVLNVESTKISYDSAKASYNDSQANYQLTSEDYEGRANDLFVSAPISGLVTEVSVQKDIMNSGNAGVTIVDNHEMILSVNVMEKYIASIESGQSVELNLDYIEDSVEGYVSNISLSANNGYYPVEITISNEDLTLVAGMFTEGYINTTRKSSVFKVEKTSLVQDLDQNNYVYVVEEDSMTVSKVQVELGIEEDGFVEIIGSFHVGSQVVVVGQDFIQDGQEVKVVSGI